MTFFQDKAWKKEVSRSEPLARPVESQQGLRVQKALLVTKIEMDIYDKYGISLL